jgi:hypothetical protein
MEPTYGSSCEAMNGSRLKLETLPSSFRRRDTEEARATYVLFASKKRLADRRNILRFRG